LQEEDRQIINVIPSATGTKSWQEKEDNLEKLHLVDKKLDESEELKNTMEL